MSRFKCSDYKVPVVDHHATGKQAHDTVHYGWMDGWMDGRMDRWTDGWMDGWMANGWMDAWATFYTTSGVQGFPETQLPS